MIHQVTILLIVISTALYWYYRKKLKRPPGRWGIPFIGNTLAVSGRPYISYSNWQKKYGKIFMVYFGPIRVLVLGSPKLIKECFQNPIFNGRPGEISVQLLTQGRNGLLTTEGAVWEDQRRFTARCLRNLGFGKKIQEDFIQQEMSEFIKGLKKQEGSSIDIQDTFELPVMNCLWRLIASKRFHHDDKEKLELIGNLTNTFGRPTVTAIVMLIAPSLLKIAPNLSGYNRTMKVVRSLHEILMEEIAEHEKSLPKDGTARDFIDAYLLEIKETTDPNSSFYKEAGIKSLLAIISEFFFGGTETMALSLSWAFLYLASLPKVQNRIQKEIDLVVGSDDRNVNLADRRRMPFSEATVLETVRKSSIVVTGVMHSAMADTTFHGYDIPKDTWIMSNVYCIHHDPEIFSDPHDFKPKRFLKSDGQTVKKSDKIVSFSLGKRSCLGELIAKDEIFLFITNVLKRFNIKLDPSKPRPTFEPQPGFLLKPQDYSIIVTERKHD